MKLNSSIFAQVALSLTLLGSSALSVNAKEVVSTANVVEAEYKADIYLDTLDADGHLSILDTESYAQKAIAEPQVAKAEVKESTTAKVKEHTTPKAEYLETKYSVAAATKAKVDDSHGGDHSTADSHGGHAGHGASKSGNSFLSAHTTEIEFTFAILVIVLGLIASERFQRAQEGQLKTASESELGLEEA